MKIARVFTLLILTFIASCVNRTNDHAAKTGLQPSGKDNLAYKWAKVALDATANDTDRFNPRPTVTSRYLALVFTAIFDAWSRYDENAVPVYLRNVERRPQTEQTLKNKEIAISFAAFRALSEYYYSDTAMFKNFMIEHGFDPTNTSLDLTTPEGIGNLAAKAVIEARHADGSNQYGDVPGSNGMPYFDYTNYKPVNSVDKMVDINHWQPKYFLDAEGKPFLRDCLTPFWDKVKPMTLDSASQFRSSPPPMMGSAQLEAEVKEVVELQSKLTDEQRALVEFMRDGPKSVQQAGHWLIFAMQVSVRDRHTLDEDVKMYFLNQITAMDAFIAAWDTKMYYDFARPYALVHHYFKDKDIQAWCGPEKGKMATTGENWRPYSPDNFLCPPFPAYVSGHSCVSGACSEALKLFTGSDTFGEKVRLVPGILTEPNNIGDTVTLDFSTFSKTAEMAGISRVLGGYHIQADNIAGLELGRQVAHKAWDVYSFHIGKPQDNSKEK